MRIWHFMVAIAIGVGFLEIYRIFDKTAEAVAILSILAFVFQFSVIVGSLMEYHWEK